MAYIAATDITVTILSKGMVGKKRRIYGSLTFDATTLTYTVTTGIPLPVARAFGFMKQVDNIFFNAQTDAVSDGIVWKYDLASHAAATGGLRAFRAAAHTTTGTCSQPAFSGVAATPTGSVAAPVFTGVEATPTGSVSAPAFVADSHEHTTILDPIVITGTVAAPAFTGVAATPTGTVSAPAFTGVAATPTGTVAAPVFAGVATAAANLAEWTNNTAMGGAIVLYWDAIGV